MTASLCIQQVWDTVTHSTSAILTRQDRDLKFTLVTKIQIQNTAMKCATHAQVKYLSVANKWAATTVAAHLTT